MKVSAPKGCRLALCGNKTKAMRVCDAERDLLGDKRMARDLLLWLLGVPIGVLVLLHLFGVLHW